MTTLVFDRTSSTVFPENPRYRVDFFGNVWDEIKQKQLKVWKTGLLNRYRLVWFGRRYWRVHWLVAICFIENPNDYTEIDHIDGNFANNHYLNLRWCTHSNNAGNRAGWKKRLLPKNVYPRHGRWAVTITKDYKHRTYGIFDTIEEANDCAIEARKLVFDQYAHD